MRDYLRKGSATNYSITHYVGYAQQVSIRRIRSHGARSGHYVARIRPGTEADEEAARRGEQCPKCDQSLWYFDRTEQPCRFVLFIAMVIGDGVANRRLHS